MTARRHDLTVALQPLLSWRVLILPYIEQDNLFKEFHLDEPWDSEHNKKLLAKMPKTYETVDSDAKKGFLTRYLGFSGKDAMFDGAKGIQFADITDGLSNTIMVVEAAKGVPWSKPEDISFDGMLDAQQQVAEIVRRDENVEAMSSTVGSTGYGSSASNAGRMFIRLTPREKRTKSADQVIADLRKKTAGVPGIKVYFQNPPPIRIGLQHAAQQAACVVVLRVVEDARRFTDLDDLAAGHHGHAPRDVPHYREIVSDE